MSPLSERVRVRLAAAVMIAVIVAALSPACVVAQSRSPGSTTMPGTISIALLDLPVVDALETLSQTARMNLVWQASVLGERARRRISCRATDATPESVLGCITRSAGLDYVRLSSGTYVVIAGAERSAYATFGGVVMDAGTGAPLPQARLQLAEAAESALTADDGGFAFPRLRPGQYVLIIRAVGYRPLQRTIELTPNGARMTRFVLERVDALARPIVVNGMRAGALSASLGTSDLTDSVARRVVASPSLFLPGTVAPLGVSRRDGTGDLHLQGGDLGEHPWRLDGIPLYDVTSLSGLLGVVSPLAIDQLTVRRSGFRASDGSFAAGVIDLRHAGGASALRAPSAELLVDPIAASARVGTPFALGRATGDVMVAGRTGLWQWTAPVALRRALRHWSVPDPVLLSRVSGFAALPGMSGLEQTAYLTSIGDEAVRLNDVHVATRVQHGLAHTVEASAFSSAQGVSYDGVSADDARAALQSTDRYDWRTTGAQVTHGWLLGTRVRQQVQVRWSRHVLTHTGSMTMQQQPQLGLGAAESNRIAELAVQAQWRLALGQRTSATLGLEGARTTAALDLANRVLRPIAFDAQVWRGTALSDVTVQLGSDHFLDAGLRVTQLQTGRTYAEPRLALRGERTHGAQVITWRVAAGGYHQFVNQFDVASTMPVAFVPSVRFWLPSDGRTPVAHAWHAATELAWRPAPGWELRGEGYARWHPSLPMFDYGVMFDPTRVDAPVGNTMDFVASARGRAFGAGVRVIRDATLGATGLRTELAYDAGAATRTFPSRFDGRSQSVPWLEPHRALLAMELAPRARVTDNAEARGLVLAARARGVWGRPWALRQAYYDLFGAAPMTSGLPLDHPGRMVRPAIVDVDLGATWERRVGNARVELGASVVNVLGRANVLDFGLRRRTAPDAASDAGDASPYAMVPRYMPGRQAALTLRVMP